MFSISTVSAAINVIGNPIILGYAFLADEPNPLVIIGWFFFITLLHPHLRPLVFTPLLWMIEGSLAAIGAGIGTIIITYFVLAIAASIVVGIIYILLAVLTLHGLFVLVESYRAMRHKDDDDTGSI